MKYYFQLIVTLFGDEDNAFLESFLILLK